VHNCKTRDWVRKKDWQVLASFSHQFQNPLPSFDVPTYLVHLDNGVHVVFYGILDAAMLLLQPSPLPRDDTWVTGSDLFSDVEP
jgi:hypothetical protein